MDEAIAEIIAPTELFMRKLYLMFAFVLAMFDVVGASAQGERHLPRNIQKAFAGTGRYAPQSVSRAAMSEGGAVSPKAYGVRIYSDKTSNDNAIVSFDVDNPSVVEEEIPISGKTIRGGVCVDGVYYLVNAPVYIAYELLSVDLNTKQMKTIATYEGLGSPEASLIVTDMTYDEMTKNVYVLAYDLSQVDEEYGEDTYPLGLFTLDLTTGKTTALGYQYYVNLVTIAASADGELYGLDDTGCIWYINKATGMPEMDLGYVTDKPKSLQSMSFDTKNNVLYWAGFSVSTTETESTGSGYLYSIRLSEDGVTPTKIGSLQDNAEIVGLYIDPDPLPKAAPAAVSNLTAIRNESGEANVKLTWKNPATTIGGSELADGFKVNVYRNDALVKTLESQTASADVALTDEDVPSSMVSYKVVCENESGEGRPVYTDSLYVGRDVPGAVTNLAATKGDGYAINLTWSKPSEGKNKGWFDENTLKYNIMRYPDETLVASNLETTSFTDNTITALHGYYYKVTAINADGEGASVETKSIVSGPAIDELPYSCDFSTDEQFRLWTIVDNDNDGQTWYLESNYGGTSDWFLKYFPDEELNPEKESDDWFISAPIKLSASKHYIVRYDLRLAGSLFPFNYRISAGSDATPEAQTIVIDDITGAVNNFTLESKVSPFTVSSDGVYYIGFQARNAVSAQITNIVIEEVSETDLQAVSLSGFTAVPKGEATVYQVEIMNRGGSAVSDYAVSLADADGNELASKTFTDEIAAQSTDTVTVEWTPTQQGKTTVYANVTVKSDANADNNRTESGLDVTVLGEGKWHHVADGTDKGGFTPFRLYSANSTAMTIYKKEEIAAEDGQKVEGIMYYYSIFQNNPLKDCPVKIYMANTELADWSEGSIAQDGWTLVYDGTMSCPVGLDAVALIFDKPFTYTGCNLAVMSVQTSEGGNTKVYFFYNIHKDEDKTKGRLLVNYGKEPYTFADGQTMKMFNDVANASFFITGEASGIGSVGKGAGSDLTLRNYNGSVYVAGGFDALRIYDLSGRIVANAIHGNVVSTASLNVGTYIVAVEKGGNKIVRKVVVTR